MKYDLLLKGGHVIDAAQGISKPMDVAFMAGKVAAIEASIPASSARQVIDVSGKYVTPGLIDCPAHFYVGKVPVGQGCDPAVSHIPSGCTTVIDGGSLGPADFPAIRQSISPKFNGFAFVNLSRLGIAKRSPPLELQDMKNADVPGAARAVSDNRDIALGIKVRLCWRGTGGSDVAALEAALQAAEQCRGSLMLHVGNSIITMPEILARLRPGDIVSHCYTLEANGIVDSRLRVLEQVWEARKRGVLFDANQGRGHQSFRVARAALSQGFPPDTISTDVTAGNKEIVGDILAVMSAFMAVGMSFDDVIARVTAFPARIISGRVDAPGIGMLRAGVSADAAVLELQEGIFDYTDSLGEQATGKHRLACAVTIKNGGIVWKAAATALQGGR